MKMALEFHYGDADQHSGTGQVLIGISRNPDRHPPGILIGMIPES
jgi:hypothetical protein